MKLPWTLRRQHRKSPYLIEGRLADVLAAIQVLGSAKRPEAAISKFAHDLDGHNGDRSVEKWRSVFRDHPEFFLVYTLKEEPKAALRWRYAYKRFDADKNKEYSEEEYSQLKSDDPNDKAIRDRLTTKPLTGDQIQTLVNTAIGLRATALEEHKANVWWVPLAAAILAFFGTIVGTWLTALLKK